MEAVNGNIEGVCSACRPGGKKGSHKEERPLSAPVELCSVALCWSMIRKQRLEEGTTKVQAMRAKELDQLPS
nr:hypothetical protein [Tanacetum cinerariifolium]